MIEQYSSKRSGMLPFKHTCFNISTSARILKPSCPNLEQNQDDRAVCLVPRLLRGSRLRMELAVIWFLIIVCWL